MPFVDLNSMQPSGNAAIPTASPQPTVGGSATTAPVVNTQGASDPGVTLPALPTMDTASLQASIPSPEAVIVDQQSEPVMPARDVTPEPTSTSGQEVISQVMESPQPSLEGVREISGPDLNSGQSAAPEPLPALPPIPPTTVELGTSGVSPVEAESIVQDIQLQGETVSDISSEAEVNSPSNSPTAVNQSSDSGYRQVNWGGYGNRRRRYNRMNNYGQPKTQFSSTQTQSYPAVEMNNAPGQVPSSTLPIDQPGTEAASREGLDLKTPLAQPESMTQTEETIETIDSTLPVPPQEVISSPEITPDSIINLEGQTAQPSQVISNLPETLEQPTSETSSIASASPELGSPQVELQEREYTLKELLLEAWKRGASDLHLAAGYRALFRIDDELTSAGSGILDNAKIEAMVREVLQGRDDISLDDSSEIDLAYDLPDSDARFRVNIYKQQGSYAAAFRLIPAEIKTLEQLKLPAKLMDFTALTQGLILVTGPTGSGKSTTLAALINEINNKKPVHILTVEDPIEYVYPQRLALITQREMHKDSESWSDALRAALRQDPDVVLVGEMRDLETISAALTIAETGHLVFATLHTNSAAQTIDRLIDVFPSTQQGQIRTQLASVLRAVVSQRLLPINGGGRRAAIEMLVNTPAVANSIREGKVYQIDNIIQTGSDIGMITMEKSLVGLVREGMISTDAALTYANHPDDVLSLLGQHGS